MVFEILGWRADNREGINRAIGANFRPAVDDDVGQQLDVGAKPDICPHATIGSDAHAFLKLGGGID